MAKKYLDDNGVVYFWQKIKTWVRAQLPSASGTTPKMDGTSAAGSESAFARGDHVHPTDTSRASASDLSSHTSNTTVHVTAAERSSWNAKQSALSFDSTPTANSSNPVTSGGVKTAIDAVDAKFANKQNAIPNADKLSIDSSGIIAARNLPGYVDDVVEVYILADGSVSAGQDGWLYMEGMTKYLPIQNAKGKIYVVVGEIADVAVSVGSATDAGEYQNTQWRWTGSQYVRLADGSGVSPITNSEIDVIVAQ